jgi:phosphopantothenoylcysteine decarboxylase/phosphopantothenate--cysteine ligase
VSACFADTDVLIMAAAVADFRPIRAAAEKIPKVRGHLTVAFEPAPDILAEVSARRSRQILVGFAAETKELVKRARRKLSAKRLDLIVANDVTEPGAGFGTETNRVTMIQRDGQVENLPLMSKREVAHRVLDAVQRLTSGEKRAGLARTLTASSRPASKRRRAHNSQVR